MGCDLMDILHRILKPLTLFMTGAFSYGLIEDIGRGYTHISMGFLGGAAMMLIHRLNTDSNGIGRILLNSLISAVFITAAEFITGEILNIGLDMDIWDYSDMFLNIDGQICLLFSFFWFILSFAAGFMDSLVCRHLFFDESKISFRTTTASENAKTAA